MFCFSKYLTGISDLFGSQVGHKFGFIAQVDVVA
uniref:Uncharacterized protein n=1 Tax=Arundo donax TaxID=35708 RepID=A0A0A8YRP5_ARUDO